MVQAPSPPQTASDFSNELAECGWRYVERELPDGTTDLEMVPLTVEEYLHPEEDFHFPNSTFHSDITIQIKDILTRRYAKAPDVGVFHDLLIEWNRERKGNLSPDVCVVFGIKNKEKNRRTFNVPKEGVRPVLAIEVVSPRYRKTDRETKVVEYARDRVKEYVIIDRRTQRGQEIEEALGYRLIEGIYQPIVPDEEGRIYCETVGLSIGLYEGRLEVIDVESGERLLGASELGTKNQELSSENQELKVAKLAAEQKLAEMAELLKRYQANE